MIVAKLKDAPAYRGIHERLDRALALLTPEFLASVTAEPTELEGKALYCFRCDYDTVPFEETFFEAHRKYLDIQLLLSGRERVDIADPATLEETEQHDDFRGLRGEAEQSVLLQPGRFLVVFPGDAHRLKIAVNGPEAVSKVVFKVLVYED